jgi:single-stranded-DNA-specific exonuclease
MSNAIEKKWSEPVQSDGREKKLSRDLKISEITAKILLNRGITDTVSAEAFLKPALKWLSSPFLLNQMDIASEILAEHIIQGKKIAIYGDYDVDGLTGTAVLLLFLKQLGAQVTYYIPNRLTEGYGLNIPAISELKSQGVNLIVTVDCGVSNHNEILYAKREGLTVIVTDHHEVPNIPSPANLVINPKGEKNSFPFRDLSGVGVAFYLAIATRRTLLNRGFIKEREINLREYLDLVALGTICDIVPLVNENRIFAKIGLELLSNSSRPGIIALKNISGVKENVSCGEVAFRLGPRINAGSRLSEAETGIKLFIEQDIENAKALASRLNILNEKRQAMEDKILSEAVELIESNNEFRHKKSIVLYNNDWHPGVIGIVASRLVELYYRPTILISLTGHKGRGSGRGISGLNLVKTLDKCRDFLIGYGGHKYAAGITIQEENISSFAEAFEKVVSSSLKEDDLQPELKIDCKVRMNDITEELCNELDLLQPFGVSNPEPNLLLNNARIIDRRIAGNNHLMLKLTDGKNLFDAVAFGMGEAVDSDTNSVNIIFYPEVNAWNGTKKLRLRIKDIKRA